MNTRTCAGPGCNNPLGPFAPASTRYCRNACRQRAARDRLQHELISLLDRLTNELERARRATRD